MEEMTVINIVIVAVLVTAVAVYLFMRRQKDAVQDEMNRLTLRLTEMELKMEAERTINNMLLASTGSSAVVAGVATMVRPAAQESQSLPARKERLRLWTCRPWTIRNCSSISVVSSVTRNCFAGPTSTAPPRWSSSRSRQPASAAHSCVAEEWECQSLCATAA